MTKTSIFLIFCLTTTSFAQFNPHYAPNRSVIVHLFEWRWNDIARECEQVLGPAGYGGVQLSPVNENAVVYGRPWYERYQPLSYKFNTRSGNEAELRNMIKRCNKVGVRVFVDVVFNHMAAGSGVVRGTSGSRAEPGNRAYPIYSRYDFNRLCGINNYQNATEVRVCELSGLPDLDQSKSYVRKQIVDFLNKLVDMGVAGFRVDAAKHMFPEDLQAIYGSVKNLKTKAGFPKNARPFIAQEVIDVGGEAVSKFEYINLGTVTEFVYCSEIGLVFQGQHPVNQLENLGPARTFLPSEKAFVFVDNHDNQRGHGGGGIVLTHKKPKEYTSAVVYTLANNYGIPRIMSSYYFDNPSMGPPHDSNDNIRGPGTNRRDGSCTGGWVCEHRWNGIRNMVKFRNAVGNAPVTNWTTYGNNALSFCRGNVGCVAFNTGKNDFSQEIRTNLAPGTYCDIISGEKAYNRCTGIAIQVNQNGQARITINGNATYGVVAFYKGSKL
ncbi:alpha-amylase 1-like [Culicoides brevitarsis]|uniref:alpha-amylase 1-like n=1 Tax=Culicoides brevitarsis TaxID=469753 RepID=UPI00307C21C4